MSVFVMSFYRFCKVVDTEWDTPNPKRPKVGVAPQLDDDCTSGEGGRSSGEESDTVTTAIKLRIYQ